MFAAAEFEHTQKILTFFFCYAASNRFERVMTRSVRQVLM